MRNKFIIMSMLVAAVLTGCSEEAIDNGKGGGTTPVDGEKTGYLAFGIQTEKRPAGRASEEAGTNESGIKSLYLLTFNDNGYIVEIPEGDNKFFIELKTGDLTKPDAVKINESATRLLAIANPGTKLKKVITDVNATTLFATLNDSIVKTNVDDIIDDVTNIKTGFSMINSGDDTDKGINETIVDPLVNIDGKTHKKIEDAEDDANRVPIKMERISSKIHFSLKTDPVNAEPTNAHFDFINWTIDAINTSYYPFAKKHLIRDVSSNNGYYKFVFYTEDSNFDGPLGAGLAKAKVSTKPDSDYLPSLPVDWMVKDKDVYSLENTMAANQQKYGNATRIVIKGKYFPDGATKDEDWFNFAGTNYFSLQELKDEYVKPGKDNLKAACDKMYLKIKDYMKEKITAADFLALTENELNLVTGKGEFVGGQVIKNGKDDVIRWYQKGICYYYYEIRHDDDKKGDNEFGKYGVVRNNWYKITLATVKGPGTPWYPEIDNPGPGDPDGEDNIDSDKGYLAVDIDVAPWVVWEQVIDL